MKRIFPDVIDAYDRLDDFHSSDDIELGIAYDEYVNRLPTFQEYFKRISNGNFYKLNICVSEK